MKSILVCVQAHSFRIGFLSMSFLQWTKELGIGVPELDEEHKILIAHLNTFYDAVHLNIAPQILLQTTEALTYYATTHFAHEEELMLATGYPDYAEHKTEHDILRARLAEMHEKAVQNATHDLSNELLAFMKGWVYGHLIYCDKPMGLYVQSCKKVPQKSALKA